MSLDPPASTTAPRSASTIQQLDDDMKIPAPWHCGDCLHFRRCSALIGSLRGDEPHCDFAPSRFRLDAIGTLGRLLEEGGATMTLYGQPVTAEQVRHFAATLAVAKLEQANHD